MKKNIVLLTLMFLTLVSCDKYLDKLPDNRAEVDTEMEIEKILVYAYPQTGYLLLSEFMSDNIDDYGPTNPYSDRFVYQVYNWHDVTESDNESPERVWTAHYYAIAHANQALQAIENAGGATTENLRQAKAEALLCRAYNHFMLVNLFSLNYNSKTSASDLGIPYIETPEEQLLVAYPRGTVAEVYSKIEKDLEEALPMVGDSYYSVPKYHFNQKAAYAFATRFYLYYEKWDKAVEYADKCLGSVPKTMLRDWEYQSTMTQDIGAITEHYIDASLNANLLLLTGYSKVGLVFNNYYMYARYSHGSYIASHETCLAENVFGGSPSSDYYMTPKVYAGTNIDRVIFWKLPYLFEYTDPVAGIGYYRTVYPAFTADECLLNRAEALVMLGKNDEAVADLNTWMHNIYKTDTDLTATKIRRFYNSINYSTWNKSTVKKHLNPAFEIGNESGVQEALLQCVLGFRRIETLLQGLRWFDIKRYGIEVERRVMNADGEPAEKTGELLKDDLRRAIQIPQKAIDAGIVANPR
ncbi:MAG: RagB/SusD family nutrient uptake outer membrane protein [Bacteroidales bacterium]|nr:RagB/SusD family nutrient uptake outer membrane protein [Bacteroidales bacterium]